MFRGQDQGLDLDGSEGSVYKVQSKIRTQINARIRSQSISKLRVETQAGVKVPSVNNDQAKPASSEFGSFFCETGREVLPCLPRKAT